MAEPVGPERERGAALLTVLLLVAVMSVVTATLLERLTIATRLSGNVAGLDQARAFGLSAEAIARSRITDLVAADPDKTSLLGGWNGATLPLPLPVGHGTARVTDGGNCFNLNSLVSGDEGSYQVRPAAVTQFRGLMDVLGVDPRLSAMVANATVDWIDSDSSPQPNGAEDDVYARAPVPYRAANTLMVDPSELRLVNGVTPDIWTVVKPWVCTLPTDDLSPININTLLPEQAPLLAMLMPQQLSVAQAQQLLAQRPADGYATADDFWNSRLMTGHAAPEARGQLGVKTRWFAVETHVVIGDAVAGETALFDAGAQPVRLVRRQWTTDG